MEYSTADIVSITDMAKDLDRAQAFTLDIDGGFAPIPVIEIVRAIKKGLLVDTEDLDRLTRFALMNKVCTLKVGGKPVAKPFVVNDLNVPWDTYEVFQQYPAALAFIFNLCQGEVIRKSMPPLKSTTQIAAAESK